MNDLSTGTGKNDCGVIRITLEVWHPDCWTLEVTQRTDAGLLGHGVYTSGDTANGRFTVYGDSTNEIEQLVDATRQSPLTENVMEMQPSIQMRTTTVSAPSNATRELFVEFVPENSIDDAFISRGFVYDGPTRIECGQERWSLIAHHDRSRVKELLDEIRAERNANIRVSRITNNTSRDQSDRHLALSRLSVRQREVFRHARDNNYYEWPREVTARELAAEFGVSKTTYLEHLRKAESKLMNSL